LRAERKLLRARLSSAMWVCKKKVEKQSIQSK